MSDHQIPTDTPGHKAEQGSLSPAARYASVGIRCVPMHSGLSRGKDGKKLGGGFESGWRAKYGDQYYDGDVHSLAMRTKEYCALDCDNDYTYDLLLKRLGKWEWSYKSVGREGGHIICKCPDEWLDKPEAQIRSEQLDGNVIALDIQRNGAALYLPDIAGIDYPRGTRNETKEVLEFPLEPPEAIPPFLVSLLDKLSGQSSNESAEAKPTQNKAKNYVNSLCPLVKQYVDEKDPSNRVKTLQILMGVLTPHKFRSKPEYSLNGQKGILPGNIPENSYYSRFFAGVAAVLAADPLIDEELFERTLVKLNNEVNDPMDTKALYKTVIDRHKGTGDYWVYDPAWDKDSKYWNLLDRDGFPFSAFNDLSNDSFNIAGVMMGTQELYLRSYKTKPEFAKAMEMRGHKLSKDMNLPRAIVHREPLQPYGRSVDGYMFNRFESTKFLDVFRNPDEYEGRKEPKVMLDFIYELLGKDDEDMKIFLEFQRERLETFRFTPVIFSFDGIQGSGKDTLFGIFANIIGIENTIDVAPQILGEKNNAWILDNLMVKLPEFGDSVTGRKEGNAFYSKLKKDSGSPFTTVRLMHQDAKQAKHNVMFWSLSNRFPFPLTADDRRFMIFHTPTKFKDTDWVQKYPSVRDAYNELMSDEELLAFCYYLNKAVKKMAPEDDRYDEAPSNPRKIERITKSMFPEDRIHYWLTNGLLKEFVKDCMRNNVPVEPEIHKGYVSEQSMIQLLNATCFSRSEYEKEQKASILKKKIRSSPELKELKKPGSDRGFRYFIPGLKQLNHGELKLEVNGELYDEEYDPESNI